jgi:hypothetical protein
MSETNLKREFSKRDVQRMRNIITGNTGGATGVQAGYEKQQNEHIEGDIWEENGRKWTIKDGIKKTMSKLSHFKKLTLLPIACPTCSQPMKNTEYNKKMYSIHKMCIDCVARMETKYKIEGKYESYAKGILNANKNNELDDFEAAVQDWLTSQNDTFVSEAGDIESWKGGKISELEIKNIKEYIAKLRATEL